MRTQETDFTKAKVVSPSFEILTGLDSQGLEKRIEECGRICYKSEHKVGRITAEPFCRNTVKRGHNSVLEMAVVSYRVSFQDVKKLKNFYETIPKYLFVDSLYGLQRDMQNPWYYQLLITGSVRAFREMYIFHPECEITTAIVGDMWFEHPCFFDDLQYPEHGFSLGIEVKQVPLIEVNELPPDMRARHRHIAVKFIVNRAVTHEIVRHRPCSYLQESQRYCRYDGDLFGNRVTYIKPMFFKEGTELYSLWEKSVLQAEQTYLKLLGSLGPDGKKVSPQAARTVLPNSCKTEIIVYANLVEWMHMMALRTSGGAEPSMREVMVPLCEEFVKMFPQYGDFKRQLPSRDSYDK